MVLVLELVLVLVLELVLVLGFPREIPIKIAISHKLVLAQAFHEAKSSWNAFAMTTFLDTGKDGSAA